MHVQSAIKKTRASNHRRGQSRTGNASKQQASNGRKQASGKQAGSTGCGYAGCATSGSFMPARSLVGACGWTAGSARGRCPRYANDERRRNEPEVQFQFGCLWACGLLRLPPRYAHEARRKRGGEVKTRARARVSATHERRLSLPCMSETPRPLRPCCVRVPLRGALKQRALVPLCFSRFANSRARVGAT